MIKFIGDDGVLRTQQRFEQSGVCVEAGRVKNRVVGAEKLTEFGFELLVDALSAADEPDGRQAITPLVQRFVGGFDHGRMLRQSEIIVRAQVEHIPAVAHTNARVLRRGNNALSLVKPGLSNLVQLPRQMLLH